MNAAELLHQAQEVTDEQVWPTPEPLEALETPLVPWPRGLILPPALDTYAAAFSDRLCVGTGVVAMGMLTVAAGIAGRGYRIRPDPDNVTWEEPLALWVAGVGNVSTKKSPILKAVAAPAWTLEKVLAQRSEATQSEYDSKLEAWENAAGNRGPKPKRPAPSRLVVSNSTWEKMASIMTNNPGLLALHDELKGLFASWKKEGGGESRAFYLAAYSGSHAMIDRVQRGTEYVESPSLSLLGFVQPGIFRRLVLEGNDGDCEGADGLLQRFVPVTVELLSWKDERPTIAQRSVEEYERAVQKLFAGATTPNTPPQTLGFDPGAQTLWRAWEAEVEKAIRNPDTPPAWAEYLGKRLGLTARLAGVLALLWDEGLLVSEKTLTRAIALVQWLEPHARRVWGHALGGDPGPAVKLARKLKAGKLQQFTPRDIYKNQVAGISTAAGANRALDRLEELGWIVREPGKARTYLTNPKIRGLPDV
ncbi:MAG: DUF3987 domain-containing protein [Thermaceae bacterium]|nr:DUF3987 domain-containing protein [Thermaceae bacterium]